MGINVPAISLVTHDNRTGKKDTPYRNLFEVKERRENGYFHGVSTRQNDTSISTPVTADSGIAFVVGAAPGHTVGGAPNDPIMCQSYAEAVAALGYSDDWEKYPICEAIYSQFKLYGVAPVVFVNVLDPAKHKKSVAEQNYPVADGKVLLPLEALKNTVKVTSYTAGTDYELFYEGENLILEVLDGGSIPAETGELTITFDAVDPSKINENDIIGGFDTSTKKYSGLELIDKVFPKYGIVPDLIVAPGWSDKSNVAAVMTAKADAINTVFTGAKALIDADTNTVRHYADVPAWKKAQNMNSKAEILCWPMFGLGDRAFHASVHAAGLMGKTDSDNGGCPAESPSNKSLQIDRAMLADGTTVLLDLAQANYLNSIKEIASLLQAMRRGEVNRLVIGPKAYGTNKWVITKLSNSLKRFDRWGNLLVASVNVTMQSYAVR